MVRSKGGYASPGSFPTPEAFRERVRELGLAMPVSGADGDAAGILGMPLSSRFGEIANRFAVQPMEGWDATSDGRPTELTRRRWRRFGASGAGMIWGGEAVAVLHEGRANPNQLRIGPDTIGDLARLREELLDAWRERHAGAPEPRIGLQLTHSGRWSSPDRFGERKPRIAFRHPLLDGRAAPADAEAIVLGDDEVRRIRDAFVEGARLAEKAGFDFVDVKHCHGYLGNELLAARTRPGPYGGDLDGRMRFLVECVEGIRAVAPRLGIGVRLNVFDSVPWSATGDGPGRPEPAPVPYLWGFGVDAEEPTQPDFAEPLETARRIAALGVGAINVTGGCPYANPHVQRPALYPPADGYLPPEDPLVGVDRFLRAARRVREVVPNDVVVVASGVSYLQEHLPAVAGAVVAEGWADVVGLGRSMLSYPEFPADVLAGRPPDRKRICRTFSECTTAPRLGLPSGCYPLDPFYRERPEAERLRRKERRRG